MAAALPTSALISSNDWRSSSSGDSCAKFIFPGMVYLMRKQNSWTGDPSEQRGPRLEHGSKTRDTILVQSRGRSTYGALRVRNFQISLSMPSAATSFQPQCKARAGPSGGALCTAAPGERHGDKDATRYLRACNGCTGREYACRDGPPRSCTQRLVGST